MRLKKVIKEAAMSPKKALSFYLEISEWQPELEEAITKLQANPRLLAKVAKDRDLSDLLRQWANGSYDNDPELLAQELDRLVYKQEKGDLGLQFESKLRKAIRAQLHEGFNMGIVTNRAVGIHGPIRKVKESVWDPPNDHSRQGVGNHEKTTKNIDTNLKKTVVKFVKAIAKKNGYSVWDALHAVSDAMESEWDNIGNGKYD